MSVIFVIPDKIVVFWNTSLFLRKLCMAAFNITASRVVSSEISVWIFLYKFPQIAVKFWKNFAGIFLHTVQEKQTSKKWKCISYSLLQCTCCVPSDKIESTYGSWIPHGTHMAISQYHMYDICTNAIYGFAMTAITNFSENFQESPGKFPTFEKSYNYYLWSSRRWMPTWQPSKL